MGSARESQEARDRAAATVEAASLEAKRRTLAQRRAAIEAQVAALEAQLEAETIDLSIEITAGEHRELQEASDRADRVSLRGGGEKGQT
jgi:circadian clock protein KaiC